MESARFCQESNDLPCNTSRSGKGSLENKLATITTPKNQINSNYTLVIDKKLVDLRSASIAAVEQTQVEVAQLEGRREGIVVSEKATSTTRWRDLVARKCSEMIRSSSE